MTSKTMTTRATHTIHSHGIAAIWLPAVLMISSRLMVKYGPNNGLGDRKWEVRG